jgi:aspartate racemase
MPPRVTILAAEAREDGVRHIGLIGGIGPAATEFYYRGLTDRHRAAGTSPELTIVHADVRDLARNLTAGHPDVQAAIYQRLTNRLKAAGADGVAITSMGGHFCVKEFAAISPLPIVNGIPPVDAAIKRQGLTTVGILGTSLVMRTKLYGSIASADVIAPSGDEAAAVAEAYGAMAGAARVTDGQRQIFFAAGARLRDRGAEAILLGGTDLFLAFDGRDPGFPVIDCAAVHIDAIYQWSIGA